MSKAPLPAGAWPVMLTPFHADRSIDWDGYRALIDFYLDAGSAGLFASCLSSEVQHLTPDEIVELSRVAVEHTAGRVPVVAGAVIDDELEQIALLARRVADTGVEAVVLAAGTLAPADADEAEWRDAVSRLMETTPGVPLGIYECPWPNHRILSAETLGWLAGTGRLLFHKDTACDLQQIEAKLEATRGTPLRFYNAHLPTLTASIEAGGAGFSGTACNFIPALLVAFGAAGSAEIDPVAQEFVERLRALIPVGYPLNAKHFLAARGVPIQPVCRLEVEADPRNLHLLEQLHADLPARFTTPAEALPPPVEA
ncbi:MAG: dihydrodipicolinate synthase family protein [Planctomycetota bacterium]